MTLFSAASIFVLAFLGLVMIVFLMFFLWLAYRYDITFSVRTKEKPESKAKPEKTIKKG